MCCSIHHWQARADSPDGQDLNFAPMLAAGKPYAQAADLAICHLETPLAPPDAGGSRELATGPTLARGTPVPSPPNCSSALARSARGDP